jgi:cyclomaltodextrinase
MILAIVMVIEAPPLLIYAQQPSWINGAVVYCVDPEIYSAGGNFAGVTAQLPRLQTLGVNVIWLMPINTRGQATGGHPNYNSPYCIQTYYGINPNYGASSDLTNLITTAHNLGMKVILDAVLNHTSWDNALITQDTSWYIHTDGNPNNVSSIAVGGWPYAAFNDVAQLNYTNANLCSYMTTMLQWWLTNYNVDGFRFDTADLPYGPNRYIPASFWNSLRTALQSVNPNILMLGECDDPALSTTPFELDYGWNLFYALMPAVENQDTTNVQSTWQSEVSNYPAGTLHMAMQDNWDNQRDVNLLGLAGAKAAAFFNFTLNGAPLLYNGMEAMNNTGGTDSHTQINWSGLSTYQPFYQQLIALRYNHYALTQGKLTWLTNSASGQLLTYDRVANGEQFVMEVNFSNVAVSGTINVTSNQAWTEMTPVGAPGGQAHTVPSNFYLQPKDFAIFQSPFYVQIVNDWQGTDINTQNGLQCTSVPASYYSGQWLFIPVDSTGVYYFIQNRWTGQYLNNQTGSLQSSNIVNTWWSAMWSRESADGTGTYYRLKNRNNGQYINNQTGPLQCTTINNTWTSAMWQLQSDD